MFDYSIDKMSRLATVIRLILYYMALFKINENEEQNGTDLASMILVYIPRPDSPMLI